MKNEYRTETDSMGAMQVPAGAYYGAQTARAVENFPVSNLRFPRSFIRALGLIKKHAALTNMSLALLPRNIGEAIVKAAEEVIAGKWDSQFVVDIFQTGSGTSTNMNANEVIANRAIELLGGRLGDKSVHPNDHVNCGQSSNDVIPSALHLAVWESITAELVPALEQLHETLCAKSREFYDVIKIGRTHLQDATPIRLGQEFSGYAAQVEAGIARLRRTESSVTALALGGTAVGTGINTQLGFAARTIAGIDQETGLNFRETSNHFAAQATLDACVEVSGALKALAVGLIKIANDVRWLGSGPRCGLGELKLPPTQPGSSIMPGKVNPVMCEMLIQAGAQVIGNDAIVTFSATQGAFELNTMLPVTAYNLLQAIAILSQTTRIFSERCVQGLAADAEKCQTYLDQSLALVTGLVPRIGYDQAARIAKTAYETGRTVRQVALEVAGLDEGVLDQLLDPSHQVSPGPGAAVGGG